MKKLKTIITGVFEMLMFLLIVTIIGASVLIGVLEAIDYQYELYQVICGVILLNVLVIVVFSVTVSLTIKNNIFDDTPN